MPLSKRARGRSGETSGRLVSNVPSCSEAVNPCARANKRRKHVPSAFCCGENTSSVTHAKREGTIVSVVLRSNYVMEVVDVVDVVEVAWMTIFEHLRIGHNSASTLQENHTLQTTVKTIQKVWGPPPTGPLHRQ